MKSIFYHSDKIEHTILLRLIVLCGTILLYSIYGYPTPDRPGIVELLVGLGLVLSLGLPQAAFRLLTSCVQEPLWMKPARLLLIYGLSAPLIMALIVGNEINAIIRDLFPFLFMMLPFFAYELFRCLEIKQHKFILAMILGLGLIFSLRGYFVLKDGGYITQNIDALYLVNAPTVLFSALFLSGYAVYYFRFYRPALPILAAIIALLPVAAMGAVLQRASFGAIILTHVVLSAFVLKQSVLRFMALIVGFIIVLFILADVAFPLIDSLLAKNRAVGSNMRLFELQAVWERVVESAATALFGQGWGGTVQSPAVGGLTVNFTHSLISASLLKTGIIGTALTMAYLGTLFLRFPILYKVSPVLAFALFWPFVIDIFLYASYKSLDFGFILMLIACYGLCKKEKVEYGAKNIDDKSGISASAPANGTVTV